MSNENNRTKVSPFTKCTGCDKKLTFMHQTIQDSKILKCSGCGTLTKLLGDGFQ